MGYCLTNFSLVDHLNSFLPIATEEEKIKLEGILSDIRQAESEGYEVLVRHQAHLDIDRAFRNVSGLVKVIYYYSRERYKTTMGWAENYSVFLLAKDLRLRDINGRSIYGDWYTKKPYVMGGPAGSPAHFGYTTFEPPVLVSQDVDRQIAKGEGVYDQLESDNGRI